MLAAIFNHLWQSTAFAAMAGLLTLALRKNHARVRHCVWLVASIKFLIPISLLIALGGAIPWRTAPIHSGFSIAMDEVSQPFTWSAAPRPVERSGSTTAGILLAVWLCGFIGISISWYVRWRRIRAVVKAGSVVQLDLPVETIVCQCSVEPGVFGVFRPVLMLPCVLSERLTPTHLDAVITHELCHLRHRDNLVAAIQMFVETVFWFHPLVWWIGKRMLEERERACDEEVLRTRCQPRAYADAILRVCRLYVESPLPCVAGVTGADLKKRIEEIMSDRRVRGLSLGRKLLLAMAGVLAVAAPVVVGVMNTSSVRAQSRTSAPKFDVASIKPSASSDGCSIIEPLPGGGLHIECVPLKTILNWAYQVQLYQISGGPAWITSENWTIVAKPDVSAATQGNSPSYEEMNDPQRGRYMDLVRQRLQSLLASRFQLAFHRETVEQTVYALTVAKDTPGMAASADQSRSDFLKRGRGQITGVNARMGTLVQYLAIELGRPVVDRTGLSGHYDFKLAWTPDRPANNAAEEPAGETGPTIFTAIQEQLGLRLEAQKGPVDVIVIDHVEKPSEI